MNDENATPNKPSTLKQRCMEVIELAEEVLKEGIDSKTILITRVFNLLLALSSSEMEQFSQNDPELLARVSNLKGKLEVFIRELLMRSDVEKANKHDPDEVFEDDETTKDNGLDETITHYQKLTHFYSETPGEAESREEAIDAIRGGVEALLRKDVTLVSINDDVRYEKWKETILSMFDGLIKTAEHFERTRLIIAFSEKNKNKPHGIIRLNELKTRRERYLRFINSDAITSVQFPGTPSLLSLFMEQIQRLAVSVKDDLYNYMLEKEFDNESEEEAKEQTRDVYETILNSLLQTQLRLMTSLAVSQTNNQSSIKNRKDLWESERFINDPTTDA